MKKDILIKGLIGIAVGVFVTMTITLGYMYFNNSESIDRAVLTNYYIAGAVLGLIYGASSFVWEIESYSMIRQLGIYFIIIYVSFMAAAYFVELFSFNVLSVLQNTIQFIVIYIILVVIHYYRNKSWVHSLNNKVGK